jgi:hypothetical protein
LSLQVLNIGCQFVLGFRQEFYPGGECVGPACFPVGEYDLHLSHRATPADRRDGDPENDFFNIGKSVFFKQQAIDDQGSVLYGKRVNLYPA